MQLTTTVNSPDFSHNIKYADSIFSIGSCFSVHITQKLAQLGYNTLQNPSGITYNAASIDRTIKMVSDPDSLHQVPLNYQHSLYSHPDFHGSFNNVDQKAIETRLLSSLQGAKSFLQKTSKVLITLGTSHVFRSLESGYIVNNCHKLPSSKFQKEVLTIAQTVAHIHNVVDRITQLSSAQQVDFIFTLSPVRHIKNGIVEDGLSKAIALLAIHQVVSDLETCHYFPAYEIQTHELRDYRFYAADLIHPSQTAIDIIYQKFSDSAMAKDEADLRGRVDSIQKQLQHRPLFPESEKHQKFLSRLHMDIAELKRNYPFINLS